MSILESAVVPQRAGATNERAGDTPSASSELSRGLASAAIYGLALGARFGAASMATHAAGVPLCFLAVGCLATPALYIGLSHAGVNVSPLALARAVVRGTATAGRMLAGLAPAALLLGVTSEALEGGLFFGVIGLMVAFWLALRVIVRELDAITVGNRFGPIVSSLFVVFATLLAARLCWLLLPLFGGRS